MPPREASVADRRIFYVAGSFEYFIAHRMHLARAMAAAGYEVHVVAPYAAAMQGAGAEGITCHPVRMDRRSSNVFREAVAFVDIFRVLVRHRPQFVHLISNKPVLYGGIAARMLRVQAVAFSIPGLGYVFTSDTAKARLLRSLVIVGYRVVFRHKNCQAIFENQDDLEVFVREGVIRAEQSVVIKGVGVDLSAYAATEEQTNDPPVVVLAARMLWNKGIREFVEAATMLSLEGVRARFVLVGDVDPGNPSGIPAAQLNRWCDDGHVEWWGFRDDMPDVLRQANIVCLPSYREGVPRVLMEAAACGRAVVTTDAPGCREVVRDGRNGIIVPVRDGAALAAALRALIEDADLRRRMGRLGREIAEQEFSVEKAVQETFAVYRTIRGNAGMS